jgi:hypothetical protein
VGALVPLGAGSRETTIARAHDQGHYANLIASHDRQNTLHIFEQGKIE